MKEIGDVKFDKANDRWSLPVKLNTARYVKEDGSAYKRKLPKRDAG